MTDQKRPTVKCPECGREGAHQNRAGTIFCLGCQICTSRKGNRDRLPGHKNYKAKGYKLSHGEVP